MVARGLRGVDWKEKKKAYRTVLSSYGHVFIEVNEICEFALFPKTFRIIWTWILTSISTCQPKNNNNNNDKCALVWSDDFLVFSGNRTSFSILYNSTQRAISEVNYECDIFYYCLFFSSADFSQLMTSYLIPNGDKLCEVCLNMSLID